MILTPPVSCRLFGMQVLSHISPHYRHPASAPVGLQIVQATGDPWDMTSLGEPAFSVHMRHPDGEGDYALWPRGETLFLKIDPIAVFACRSDRLEFQRLTPLPDEALQWQTFGLVLSAWSEWAGRPVLHAATVEAGQCAVGFLGRSGAGKSSITLEFLSHGHRILGDDQLILQQAQDGVVALPAIPWLKLAPEVALRAGLNPESLPRVHSGSEKRRLDIIEGEWPEDPVPLGPIYLINRTDDVDDVRIDPMSPAESLIELVRHSYVPRTVAHSGLAGARLDLLARAVQQRGVWHLRYPNGIEWLHQVRQAVVDHVSTPA